LTFDGQAATHELATSPPVFGVRAESTYTCLLARINTGAADADREEAVAAAKTAYVDGRLSKEEFDVRVGQALTARTCEEVRTAVDSLRKAP